MGFFSKIFKGIKKIIKGIGKVIKKVVKSKAFKVIAAIGLAIVAPQLIPTMLKGLSTAGAWAASTIATGASAAWAGITAAGGAIMSGVQAAGGAIMQGARAAGGALMKGARAAGQYGSKIFRSVTETISSGIKYMKAKIASGVDYTKDILGFGKGKFVEPAHVRGLTPAEAIAEKAAKAPFDWKKFRKEKIFDPFIETGIEHAKDKVFGPAVEEEQRESLLGPQFTPVERYTAASQKNYGLAPLMNLAANTQSPYLSYQQTQQAFAAPPSLATVGNV